MAICLIGNVGIDEAGDHGGLDHPFQKRAVASVSCPGIARKDCTLDLSVQSVPSVGRKRGRTFR
jgi:hypothetical protein